MHLTFAALLLTLAVLQPLWHGMAGGWAMILALVLMVPLSRIVKKSARAAAAACFLAMPFFVHGVMEATVNPDERIWALVETGLCTALFVTLVLWTTALRNRRRMSS